MSPTATLQPSGNEIRTAGAERNAWTSLVGMDDAKQLIDCRVVLPLRERERAEKHGLTPPGAILLFGPPGTGKTSLARGIAGQLGWLFADLNLPAVALDAAHLRELFERLGRLDRAVILFDEFEYLGPKRDRQPAPVAAVTAELLRGLSGLHAGRRTLVVCATNYARLLDPALLRPGRFDLVLPIGLPNAAERAHLLRRLLARHRCGAIQLDRLLERSERFTPADLEAVCRRAAQAAFEREIRRGRESQIEMDDLLIALERHRPTVSTKELAAFHQDVARFARY